MSKHIELASLADMTLANAERVAFDGATVKLSNAAKRMIMQGRERFKNYLEHEGGYVYGATTAPGSRAKTLLSDEDSRRQGDKLRNFTLLQAGLRGAMLPDRCVRLALFARLTNAMTGAGQLSAATVTAIADLLHGTPPPVPMHGQACSGEVMPLTWLMAPLAEIPLGIGEAMALLNGSPFATAMACDVAMTTKRRLRLSELIFALSVEVSQCPTGHFDPRLARAWPDPYYRESLERLHSLLSDSQRIPIAHQAPTSWRVLPNVLAHALHALEEASLSAEIGLKALKSNPTFIISAVSCGDELVVSSAGFHDHRAAKAVDQVNSALTDLCVLASRQVSHLLDGTGFGLPPLLARAGDEVGAEFLAWCMTEPLATARRAAEATTLDLSLRDPAGDQSDIASLSFIAYAKHREVASSFDACIAALAAAIALALEFRDGPLPNALRPMAQRLVAMVSSVRNRVDVVAEPLEQLRAMLHTSAEAMTSEGFAAMIAKLPM